MIYVAELQKKIIAELGVSLEYSLEQEIERRIEFLRKFLRKTGRQGFVLGLSGGQDSTLAGKLAQMAAGLENKRFIAVEIPYGIQQDAADVLLAIDFIKPDAVQNFDIKSAVDSFCQTFLKAMGEAIADFNKGNVKARLRMIVQYAIAAKEGMAVIGTDHASENLMGFFTKHGDGAADVLPLYGLTKYQGRELLKALDCPAKLYLKQPTADLLDNDPLRPDEDELGVTYSVIEDFLTGKPVSDADFTAIIKQFNKTKHKRKLPAAIGDFWEV